MEFQQFQKNSATFYFSAWSGPVQSVVNVYYKSNMTVKTWVQHILLVFEWFIKWEERTWNIWKDFLAV